METSSDAKDPPTPWASRILDLKGKGMTLLGIGKVIGLSKQAVFDLGVGRSKEPRLQAAIRLQELHKSVMTKKSRRRA